MRKTNRFIHFLFVVITITLAASFIPQGKVRAALPVLSISPASSTALTCDDYIITVKVADVVDLNAYDILLQFTSSIPGAIQILEVTNAGFLDTQDWVIPLVIDNVNGRVRAQMTQYNPSSPKSGNGDLLRIRIRSLVPGATVSVHIITADDTPTPPIPTKLSAIGGVPIEYAAVDGSFVTSGDCPYTMQASVVPQVNCITEYPTSFTLTVKVKYAVDLWGYSLKLSFEPGSIFISSVSNGDFLTQGIAEPTNVINNTTGTISWGIAQTAPTNPQTGSGTLLTISGIVLDNTPPIVHFDILESSRLIYWNYVTVPPGGPGAPADAIFTNTDGVISIGACDPNDVDTLIPTADRDHRKITVNWQTVNEQHIKGFNVYRSGSLTGLKKLVNNDGPIQAEKTGMVEGYVYSRLDRVNLLNKTYYYWVETVYTDEHTVMSDPIKVKKWK